MHGFQKHWLKFGFSRCINFIINFPQFLEATPREVRLRSFPSECSTSAQAKRL